MVFSLCEKLPTSSTCSQAFMCSSVLFVAWLARAASGCNTLNALVCAPVPTNLASAFSRMFQCLGGPEHNVCALGVHFIYAIFLTQLFGYGHVPEGAVRNQLSAWQPRSCFPI